MPFYYTGCNGNNNNFFSREECEADCPPDVGKHAPSNTNIRYKTQTLHHTKFNLSRTEKEICTLPAETGGCSNYTTRWYFDTLEKECRQFYYGGCGGNGNNFQTEEECTGQCKIRGTPATFPPSVVQPTADNKCELPSEVGECFNYTIRWYFDSENRQCRQFYYGGCGGNENNYESEEECSKECARVETPVTGAPSGEAPSGPEVCFLASDPGPCRKSEVRWYYDSRDGVCRQFMYGGCQGNGNNYGSREECVENCGNVQGEFYNFENIPTSNFSYLPDLCSLPVVVGPCDADYIQWYYDSNSDTCMQFKFGGCYGNDNRFHDQQSCEQRCKKSPYPATQAPVEGT